MIRKSILFVSACFCALTANAQSYTEHLQDVESGQGRVTVNQTSALDSLVNGFEPVVEKIIAEVTPEAPKTTTTTTGTTARRTTTTASTTTTARTNTTTAAASTKRKESGVNHVIKSGETVNVFSILVYSGGNSREAKEKAQAIAAQVNAKFPGSGARASFSPPRWIVITGAYASQEVATANLKRMKAMGFSQASITRRSVVKK